MEKTYDVVALGELLIDFTQNGTSNQGNPMFEANPGGAPCNVLSLLSKWHRKTGFIGKVGDDMFGTQLENAIKEVGIDTSGLVKDKKVHTTLAFVHTFPDGDRDFSFYRNPGADMMLSVSDLNEKMLADTKIFHFGSLSMTADGCFEATKKAIAIAKTNGAIISFDPNLREPLWESLDKAKEKITYGIEQCDILKISDNEILWFTGKEDYDSAVKALREKYKNIKLLLLSLGKHGSRAVQDNNDIAVSSYVQKKPLETTGAGDTFCGTVLDFVLTKGLKEYTKEELERMLCRANGAASIVTTRKGALRVMPTKDEMETLVGKD